jgi:hypothetical protein
MDNRRKCEYRMNGTLIENCYFHKFGIFTKRVQGNKEITITKAIIETPEGQLVEASPGSIRFTDN